MPTMERREARRLKARPRGAGVQAFRVEVGAASDEAAKHQIDRRFEGAERTAALLHLNGDDRRVLRHLERIEAVLDDGPAPALHEALHAEGHAGRQQDETVEALVDGITPDELDRLEVRTRRSIMEARALLRAIRAHRESASQVARPGLAGRG